MIRKLYDWTVAQARSPRAVPVMGTISFVESSIFPIPADVIFVPMCAAKPEASYRYALIATVTSVLGGIAGWCVGHYGYELIAQPILEFYGKADEMDALRAQAGDGTFLILLMLITSGLAHLPPMKVVTILSGVLSFSLPLFILSAIVARGARFYALAWLLRRYGEQILAFIEKRLMLVSGIVVALAVLAYVYVRSHG